MKIQSSSLVEERIVPSLALNYAVGMIQTKILYTFIGADVKNKGDLMKGGEAAWNDIGDALGRVCKC